MSSAYLYIPPEKYTVLIYHQTTHMLDSSKHVPIWQVSPQLSCGDIL